MIEDEDALQFLNRCVGVVYNDSGRDYFLKGLLTNISHSSLTLENKKFGRCLVSLDSVKKIKELIDDG